MQISSVVNVLISVVYLGPDATDSDGIVIHTLVSVVLQ